MELLQATDRGDWLLARIGAWATVGGVAGTGFEAYARILHPVDASHPTISEVHWRWAEVARRNGRTMHPLVQWMSLTDDETAVEFDDGWSLTQSEQGRLAPDLLAALTMPLRRATATPGLITAGIWPGWGEINGGSSLIVFTARGTDPEDAQRERARLQAQRDAAVSSAVREAVARGPLLDWPGRGYLLFDTSLDELADPQWPSTAGLAGVMPQLIWPADQSWVVASEIDWDSTIVAGSRALVDDILAHDGFESFEVTEDADLSIAGDTVNPLPQGRMGG